MRDESGKSVCCYQWFASIAQSLRPFLSHRAAGRKCFYRIPHEFIHRFKMSDEASLLPLKYIDLALGGR